MCVVGTEATQRQQSTARVGTWVAHYDLRNSQVLYPPLTFLRATGARQTITVGDSTLTIMEVVPSM